MIFKKIKPVTPSQRHLIKLKTNYLIKKPILKNKIKGLKNPSGRNNSGKITVFHKGGGSKKKYRTINFLRIKKSIGIICSIEYDPYRNAFISAVYEKKEKKFFYVITPYGIKIGDIIKTGQKIQPYLGNSLPLSEIPQGTSIHNISLQPGKLSTISRSAGSFSTVIEKEKNYILLKISSNKFIKISPNCTATIGEVSNGEYFLTQKSKAGHSRWLNIRPTVRGVAMNPIDHPHGGGEGKKSGKRKTPWGKII
jgi:large subunit ribosomal protein L2